MLNGLALFDIDEDALHWLRARQETSLRYFAAIRQQIDRLNRKVKLGAIPRWVRTIHQWNPGLTEADCFAVVKAWFGIELPGIRSLEDMEMGFPDEFFDRVVYPETRRALEAVGDDAKVIAYPNGYWPSDTPRPDTFNGGRKPGDGR